MTTKTMTSTEAIARLTSRPPVGASKLLSSVPLEIDAARGFARMSYLGKPEFCDQHGMVQGGFLSAMMDEAMAIAATASKNFGHVVPTLGMKTSYFMGARPGPLIAEGMIRHAGARVIYLEGRLYDADGDLAATATATARLRKAAWL